VGAEHDIGSPDEVVRLVPGVDLSTAKLTAVEGFVLSRVDGVSSMQTICLLTGLGTEQTMGILADLRRKGLLLVGDEQQPEPRVEHDRPRERRGGTEQGVGAVTPGFSGGLEQVDTVVDATPAILGEPTDPEPPPEPPEADSRPGEADSPPAEADASPAEADASPAGSADEDEWHDSDTDEECELKPERRKQIRELHGKLGQLNLFELLGVSPDAEIKKIRKAFFVKSKVYHPDRYFNRKLGPYGAMLHEIFKQMNAGYKMLCDKEKLAQYREMVVQQQEQERLADEVARQAEDYLQEEQRAEEEGRSVGEHYSAIRKRSGTFRAHRAKALMDLVGQRQGGERPPSEPAPAVDDPERRGRRQSDHQLRAKRVTGALFSRAKKALQFLAQGKQQLERGQYLAATASLKLAMTYNPEDREAAEAFQLAARKAGELTAENYYRRGMMEESVGRFDAAAESFVRAAEQHRSAAYLMKAAEAMLWSHDSGDLIKAKDYATRAVQADPNSVDVRLIAAKVYRAAGMKQNARRELQMALKIEPGNAEAKELLKGV